MIRLHIKIGEFEFIERDLPDETPPERLQELRSEYLAPFTGKAPVTMDFSLQLQKIVNSDLCEGWGSADAYQALPTAYKDVLQSLKRFKARLKDHNKEE